MTLSPPIGIAIATALLLLFPMFLRRWRRRAAASSTPARRAATLLQTARTPGPRSVTDLCELLREEEIALGKPLQTAGMALEMKLEPVHLAVHLDRPAIRFLFAQIVELACRVMPPGSSLQVLARKDGAHAVVNFMDAGPCIEEPQIGRQFERVSTLRSGRHPNEEVQCALLCAQIVSDHGGRIYAAPSPLGRLGLTVRLPRTPADRPRSAGEAIHPS